MQRVFPLLLALALAPAAVPAEGTLRTIAEIDAFIELARQKDVIVTTFGDLMRVPGSTSSLQRERAEGRDIRMVYSTVDALAIARTHPGKQVVVLGVGGCALAGRLAGGH